MASGDYKITVNVVTPAYIDTLLSLGNAVGPELALNQRLRFLTLSDPTMTVGEFEAQLPARFARIYPTRGPLKVSRIINGELADLDPGFAIADAFSVPEMFVEVSAIPAVAAPASALGTDRAPAAVKQHQRVTLTSLSRGRADNRPNGANVHRRNTEILSDSPSEHYSSRNSSRNASHNASHNENYSDSESESEYETASGSNAKTARAKAANGVNGNGNTKRTELRGNERVEAPTLGAVKGLPARPTKSQTAATRKRAIAKMRKMVRDLQAQIRAASTGNARALRSQLRQVEDRLALYGVDPEDAAPELPEPAANGSNGSTSAQSDGQNDQLDSETEAEADNRAGAEGSESEHSSDMEILDVEQASSAQPSSRPAPSAAPASSFTAAAGSSGAAGDSGVAGAGPGPGPGEAGEDAAADPAPSGATPASSRQPAAETVSRRRKLGAVPDSESDSEEQPQRKRQTTRTLSISRPKELMPEPTRQNGQPAARTASASTSARAPPVRATPPAAAARAASASAAAAPPPVSTPPAASNRRTGTPQTAPAKARGAMPNRSRASLPSFGDLQSINTDVHEGRRPAPKEQPRQAAVDSDSESDSDSDSSSSGSTSSSSDDDSDDDILPQSKRAGKKKPRKGPMTGLLGRKLG